MKRLLAIVCCSLVIAGCGSPAVSSSAPVKQVDTIPVAEGYQAVSIGGYHTEIPEDWPTRDGFIFLGSEDNYPYISYVVIEDYQALDELFPDQSAMDAFANGVCEEFFQSDSYSCSDVTKTDYKGNPSVSFTAADRIDGIIVTYSCHLFNNPGGGVLAYSLCSNAEGGVEAIDAYSKIMSDMIPVNFD